MSFIEIVRKYQDAFYFLQLQRSLSICDFVLDVGCGADSPIGKIKKTFKSVGVDIYRPSILESKKKKIHTYYKLGNFLHINKMFKPQSFDAVIALDVIEHLEKKDATSLIKKMETITKKRVIILTPNGFYHQDHLDGNPHQEHKSGWETSDLKKMGYKVYGLRGLKYIRGDCATIKYKPWLFWGIIAFITEPLLFLFPDLSYHLFAVKDISNEKI